MVEGCLNQASFSQWTGGNTKEAKQANVGIFNIVLGLSLVNLNMDCVESFAFSFGSGGAHSYGPLEVMILMSESFKSGVP